MPAPSESEIGFYAGDSCGRRRIPEPRRAEYDFEKDPGAEEGGGWAWGDAAHTFRLMCLLKIGALHRSTLTFAPDVLCCPPVAPQCPAWTPLDSELDLGRGGPDCSLLPPSSVQIKQGSLLETRQCPLKFSPSGPSSSVFQYVGTFCLTVTQNARSSFCVVCFHWLAVTLHSPHV